MSYKYSQQEFRMLLAGNIASGLVNNNEFSFLLKPDLLAKKSLEIANEIIRQGSDQMKYSLNNNITDHVRSQIPS